MTAATTPRRLRSILVAAGAATMLLGLAGCSSSVPKDDVASQIVAQLKPQGVTVDDDEMTCPDDLPAEVGKSVTCEFTAGGQAAQAVATVTSVNGDDVAFSIESDFKK